MYTKEDFMRKILVQPEEDTPRLVYADFLEERCDEPLRARLIRVQCRLSTINNQDTKTTYIADIEELKELRKQEKELLSSGRVFDWIHFIQCMSGMPEVNYLGGGVCKFWYDSSRQPELYATWRRGFVESLTCTAEDWVRHSGGIWPSEEEPYYETAHPLKIVYFRRWMGLNQLNHRLLGNGKTAIIRNELLTEWYKIEPTIPTLENTTKTSDLVGMLFGKVYPGLRFELVS